MADVYKKPSVVFYYRCNVWGIISVNQKAAWNAYNKTINLDPQIAETYEMRGYFNPKLGNYQKAINDYNNAIDINPKHALAYYHRGDAYHKLKNYQQALDELSKSIEVYPSDQYMLLYLAYYQRKDMVVPANVARGWVDCLNIITVV